MSGADVRKAGLGPSTDTMPVPSAEGSRLLSPAARLRGFISGEVDTSDPRQCARLVAWAKAQDGWLRWRLREEWACFKKQWVLIVCAAFWLIYCVLMVFLNVAYYRYGIAYGPAHHNETKCLADLVHPSTTLCIPRRLRDLGYDFIGYHEYPDIPMYILMAATVVFLLMLFVPPRNGAARRPPPPGAWEPMRVSPSGEWEKPLAVNCVRRVGCVFAVGHTLRALTYLSTAVPGAADHCLRKEKIEPPTAAQIFYQTASTSNNCGDLIFSGHLLITILLILNIHRYGAAAFDLPRAAHRGVVGVAVLLGVLQSLVILAARHHYSVDVVVAWYLTPLLWYFYNGEWPKDVPPPVVQIALGMQAKLISSGDPIKVPALDPQLDPSVENDSYATTPPHYPPASAAVAVAGRTQSREEGGGSGARVGTPIRTC